MANLNFKWGSHAKLSTLTSCEVGTLYFTKDEGSLYLGVDANKAPQRIQGVVQHYTSTTAFAEAVKPPYASDVIYYIEDQGALIRWDAAQSKFVIINVTAAEFTSTVTTINQSIMDNAANIATVDGKADALRTDLGEAGAAAGTTTAFARIKALESAVDALEELTGTGGSGSLTDRISALETWKAEAVTQISDLEADMLEAQASITTHGGKITALEGRADGHDGKITTIENQLKDLATADADLDARLDVVEPNLTQAMKDIDNVEADLLGVHSTISGHGTAITNLQTGLAQTNANVEAVTAQAETNKNGVAANLAAIGTINTTISGIDGRVSNLETDNTNNKGDISSLKAAVGTNDGKGALFTRVAALEAEVTEADTAAALLEARVKANEDNITTLTSDLDKAEKAIEDANASILENSAEIAKKANQTDLNALKDRVDGHDTAINTANDNIAKNAQAITAVDNRIGKADGSEANTVYAAIKQNASDILTNASDIADNASEIAKIKSADSTRDDKISDIEDEIEAIKSVNTTQGKDIKDLNDWKATASNTISNLDTDMIQAKKDIAANTAKFGNYYTKTEADGIHEALETELRDELTNHINAANALTYISGIGDATTWNGIKAKDAAIGHVYVVTTSGLTLDLNGTNTTCYAGDLLIATAKSGKTETNGVLAGADIAWVHVKAGYNSELADNLSIADADGTDANKKATVRLTSYAGAAANNHGDLGKFTLVADSDNLEIAVSGEEVKVSMVWAEF